FRAGERNENDSPGPSGIETPDPPAEFDDQFPGAPESPPVETVDAFTGHSAHRILEVSMSFRILGLPREPFQHLLDAGPETLRQLGVVVEVVDEPHSAPCRITLEDAEVGEEVLLLSHRHLDSASPYAAAGPIYVRRKARERFDRVGVVPDQQRRRLLSVRGYDAHDMMMESEVVPGAELESLIARFFATPTIAYLHVHNARPGCYACRVERA